MDVTSVANMATLMAQSKALTEVGYAVMGMQMDDMKMEGAEVAQMIQSAPSIDPNVGGNFDMSPKERSPLSFYESGEFFSLHQKSGLSNSAMASISSITSLGRRATSTQLRQG